MGRLRVSVDDGIIVDLAGKRFALDPTRPVSADYTFVSHAHLDHVHNPSRGSRIITSFETKLLAKARGYDLGNTHEKMEGINLLDSGHILGARSIRIEEELLYTGDASGRDRAFLGKCKTRPARVLITEATYGRAEYHFPPTAEIVKEVNTLIGETFDKGRPVILMGYPLGKAQVLSYLFSSWTPFYIDKDVAKMNEVHRSCGVDLKKGRSMDSLRRAAELPRGPWVMITPIMNSKSKFMTYMKRHYGAVIVAFSGWAVYGGFRNSLGADFAFPLSDHCDYSELMKLVKAVSPELVYTTHGFAEDFARQLRKEGYDAKTLGSYQRTLSDYLIGD